MIIQPAPARRKCSFDLSSDLARQFRTLCAIQGVKQRRVVEWLLEGYVQEHEHELPAHLLKA